ncbi:sodium-extruding oxaloacetate decarboxylase subunit alpha [Candidatus Methanoperedens nitratireducens]|uniref:Pyruvate carboxylase subunit B n=1 Tax=Candidatus Methanoperedens nitratireducens TaxID=1392998 RepID=A0A284VMY1_9EURY|nr:sodium-extruding oxaloacetate decarboxylase subunit alpha [Candidatus Methanoperedens nitroreducens]SNQ60651.1 Pyruvate carboxylase subunit B [Candidatus Methanoperedens nitroreducens]
MAQVKLTDTTLRDAHQSLVATRMRTRDMLPIAEKMDEVGFFSLEVWGGATFDSSIRYLNEDPWERLRALKKAVKKTPLQMLLRGQNLVGYRHYSDDIVVKFVEHAAETGVDIFRIFDAVNDIRNMEVSIKTAKRVGAHVQGTVCYTISPVHPIPLYVKMAKQLEGMGCDSLCIKDMAGLISPKNAHDLVKALKKEISIPVDLHSHCTSGMAPMSYLFACEAGVNILDTAFSPFAWGTSQPPTETTVAALKGTPYDTGLDLFLLTEIKKYFEDIKEKYRGILDPISERIDTNVLKYQIPGGMLSNLVSQLKEQNALDKYNDVLAEMPRVREELGYPPLVTPTSQIVGTQAVLNILMGERYKVVPKEVKDYVKGLYGRTPAPISKEIITKILGNEQPITCRPADLLPPELDKVTKEAYALGIVKKPEDILTYALYPAIAPKFLRGEAKEEALEAPKPNNMRAASALPSEFKVEVDGDVFDVKIISAGGGSAAAREMVVERPKAVDGAVTASMQGMVLKVKVKKGDSVAKGDVVMVLEAMKMENNIHAPHAGAVKEILVKEGSTVSAGDTLLIIG